MSKWKAVKYYEKTGFWNAEKTTPQWVRDTRNACRVRCYPTPHHDQFKAVAAEEEIARLTAELAQRDKKIRSDKTIVKLESELAQRYERIRNLVWLAHDLFEDMATYGELSQKQIRMARELGVKEKQ